MSEEEPKIIIDEDWKSQVERERETALEAKDEEALDEGGEEEVAAGEASFEALVASLASQAMFALGLIAQPDSEQVMIDLDQAKFVLDLLAILGEKTQGNLSEEEDVMLGQALSEMQQVYMARVQQYQESAMQDTGIDPMNLQG
jgi:hypothetical protein